MPGASMESFRDFCYIKKHHNGKHISYDCAAVLKMEFVILPRSTVLRLHLDSGGYKAPPPQAVLIRYCLQYTCTQNK